MSFGLTPPRDFISVHDVARANMLAMEKEEANYEIFNVGTGIPMQIKRVAEVLAELYGKDIQPEITHQFRKGDVRHCYSDNTKNRKNIFTLLCLISWLVYLT